MNLIKLHTPFRALLWERMRLLAPVLPLLVLVSFIPFILAYIVWYITESLWSRNDTLEGFSFLWIITHYVLCSAIVSNNDVGDDTRFYPAERHYLLPVRPLTLAMTQLVVCVAAIVLFWTIIRYVNLYLFDDLSLLNREFFASATHWALGISCYFSTLVGKWVFVKYSAKLSEVMGIALCTLCAFTGIYVTPFIAHPFVGLVGIVLVSLLTVWYIGRSRVEFAKAQSLSDEKQLNTEQIERKVFTSKLKAQLWYEWREWGKYGVIMVFFIIAFGNIIYFPVLWYDYYSAGTIPGWRGQILSLSFISCPIIGLWLSYSKSKNNKSQDFVFNRPINTRNIFAYRYYMAIIIALACVTLPLALAFVHDHLFTYFTIRSAVRFVGTLMFVTTVCTLLIMKPITTVFFGAFNLMMEELQYELSDSVYEMMTIFLGVTLFLAALGLLVHGLLNRTIKVPILLFVLLGLFSSRYFIVRFDEPVLFVLLLLMPFLIGVYTFSRSRSQ